MQQDIGAKLKKIRILKGLRQSDVADKINVSPQSIGYYESGKRNPSVKILSKLSTLYGVPLDDLIEKPNANIMQLTPYSTNDQIMLPIIGKVACGFTCLAEQKIEGFASVDRSIINSGYEYAWLRVAGDSMSPKIEEGDLALIRFQDDLDAGIGVVIVDEEDGLLKKIRHEPDKITLESFNPYYPPRVFKKEEMNRVRIVGKLVRTQRDYN